MTIEKMKRLAYKWTNGMLCCVRGEEAQEYHQKMLELLEREEKYRWHDLRKNPDDLPINDYGKPYSRRRTYLVKPQYNEYVECKYGYANYKWWVSTRGYSVVEHVIAWREIELFEEDENEQ